MNVLYSIDDSKGELTQRGEKLKGVTRPKKIIPEKKQNKILMHTFFSKKYNNELEKYPIEPDFMFWSRTMLASYLGNWSAITQIIGY